MPRILDYEESAFKVYPTSTDILRRFPQILQSLFGACSISTYLPFSTLPSTMLKTSLRAPRSCLIPRRSSSRAASASTILVQHHPAPQSGSIRVLLLDRPDARNALSKQLIADLRRQVDEIQAKGPVGGIRALVIASNSDNAFCAGADLRERRGMGMDE